MKETASLPILLIGYNRPDFFQDRLNELRVLPIRKLYISIDSISNEISPEISKLVNEFVGSEPNFQVWVNFESQNQGLTRHITSAISRVLEVEEAVIVVEDDISLSIQSYNAFNAGHLISKSMRLTGVVSGFSPLVQPVWFQKNIWRRTPYFAVWGWVATQQNWSNYTFDITKIDISKELENSRSWRKLSSFQKSVWLSRFNRAQRDPLLTWDIQMQYFSFQHDYVNLVPLFRVVENLGFNDSRAVHTKFKKPRWFRTSDPRNAITPANKMKKSVDNVGYVIDSITLAGDSRMLHIWTHKIRKKLLKY
jgi:hypothetical protein